MLTKTRRSPLNPPPPRNSDCEFQLEDGSWKVGWSTYDQFKGWRYFIRSIDAPRPSRGITSRWDIEGCKEVSPLAWRPHHKPKVTVPADPISRREAEIILKRAVLTDGTLHKSRQSILRSTWDTAMLDGSMALIDQLDLLIFDRFSPEPFDNDNYLIGMDWLARINKKAKGFNDLNREQEAVVWRAYDFSFEWIGRIKLKDVSRQRAREIYTTAVDRAWGFALAADCSQIRRLSRSFWEG